MPKIDHLSPTTGMSTQMHWARLPAELRILVFEAVVHSCTDRGDIARSSAVSREWQAFFKPFVFCDITLTSPRVTKPESKEILDQNNELVQYIFFRINMKLYYCSNCPRTGPRDYNNYIRLGDDRWCKRDLSVRNALGRLFDLLSIWEPRAGGLALDLTAFSHQDWEHHFKYLEVRPESSVGLPCPPLRVPKTSRALRRQDLGHGWSNGTMIRPLPRCAMDIIFGKVMDLDFLLYSGEDESKWWAARPSLPAVTSVIIRSQCRRRWNSQHLGRILGYCPNLEQFFYEPWRSWSDTGDEQQRILDFATVNLMKSLDSRPRLRHLMLFENFNEFYTEGWWSWIPPRVPGEQLSHQMARTSRRLEVLSASFLVDAGYFFKAYRSRWTWENLTTLALTSTALAPDVAGTAVDAVLQNAATAALRMPKLATMELWNGRRGVAMLFRYAVVHCRVQTSATITIRGTHELVLSDRAVQAWKAVASEHRHGIVTVETSSIDANLVKSHGDAICLLGLTTQVIRPVSLQQILDEHKIRAGEWPESRTARV